VLKIKTNENVTYDVNEPGDKGVIWMDQIMEFISWINHVNINSEMITEEIYGRRLNNYEEFYNPNL
jgi:hypothetical protein